MQGKPVIGMRREQPVTESEQAQAGPLRPVAMVTGGGVRVGRAIALGLVADGYDLVASCRRSVAGAEEVARRGREAGARVRIVQADLATEEGAARVAGAVRESFGRLDGESPLPPLSHSLSLSLGSSWSTSAQVSPVEQKKKKRKEVSL